MFYLHNDLLNIDIIIMFLLVEITITKAFYCCGYKCGYYF